MLSYGIISNAKGASSFRHLFLTSVSAKSIYTTCPCFTVLNLLAVTVRRGLARSPGRQSPGPLSFYYSLFDDNH